MMYNHHVLLSEFINELQVILEKEGDVEVKIHDRDDDATEEALIEMINKPERYAEYQLEKGCRCLSCYERVQLEDPFVLIT